MFNAIGKASYVDAATLILEEMSAENISPHTCTFSRSHSHPGKSKVAGRGRSLVCEGCREKLGVANVVIYTTMITPLSKAGEIKEDLKYFDKMIKAGHSPNVVWFSALIFGLCGAGRVKTGFILSQSMNAAGCTPNLCTFKIVSCAFAEQGVKNHVNALTAEPRASAIEPNRFLYSALLASHKKSDNADAMCKLLAGVKLGATSMDTGLLNTRLDVLSSGGKIDNAH